MNPYHSGCCALLLFCLAVLPGRVAAAPPLKKDNYEWVERIRSVHPRLFLTKEDVPRIRTAASGYEKATYDAMKERVDQAMGAPVEFRDPLARTGESNANHAYGFRASEAAMVYLITGDTAYLNFAKLLLRKLTEYYLLRVENNLNIHWYAFSQICTLCAYDWIYNDLTPAERDELGSRLFRAVDGIAWHGSGIRKARFRENTGNYRSGCYGPPVLPWYLGLTFHGDGIDDKRCVELLKSGYDLHQQMTEFRAMMIGERGGAATACVSYAFGRYPPAEFDFIHTFRSATGIDIAEDMSYILGYLKYIDWIRLPGNREYGLGDAYHNSCLLPHRDMNAHVAEIVNLYGGKHPEILPVAGRLLKEFSSRQREDALPFLRLLHVEPPEMTPEGGVENRQHSIHFEMMGQVYMRSGVGDDDTYALFVTGGVSTQHKHYDNNHFIIYKHGYRALDSGTRPQPGLHLSHYYARTVAHNCVTIRMPGETMPKYWGGAAATENRNEPVPNDGGQCNLLGSKLLALEETADYVYLASDATGSYHADKAKRVVREFIYCMPDLFVVFDRVVSTDPSYDKSWLFHTAAEPKMDSGMEFSEQSRGGKTICRTLFPRHAKLEKIGGPDKQFWSDGRNWPLPVLTPDDYTYGRKLSVPSPTHPELGQWRVEVTPGEAAREDLFMHIIQVGDRSLSKLPGTATFDRDDAMGVEFSYNGKKFKIAFDKKAHYGCNIDVNR